MLIEREQEKIKKAQLEDEMTRLGSFFFEVRMQFCFLSTQFYLEFSSCSEIEKKTNRPYAMTLVSCNQLLFAVPLRSNINHPNVIWTDKQKKCGLDLSKAVVITNRDLYIDQNTIVTIRQNEFDALRGKEHFLQQKLETYIKKYKKAYGNISHTYNIQFCQYSALQYFHKELGIQESSCEC